VPPTKLFDGKRIGTCVVVWRRSCSMRPSSRRTVNAGCALGGNDATGGGSYDSGIVGTIVGAIVARTSALLVVVDRLTKKH
jgi:hypothetical protein